MIPPLLLALVLPSSESRVISVFYASRHGTRAPNPIVEDICPGLKPTLDRFKDIGIAPAGVTGNGLREMYSVGVYARERYIKEAGLLSKYFDPREIKFVAAEEDRTLQSAATMGQAMYAGPRGFEGYREPIPVAVNGTAGRDDLGEVRKATCAPQLLQDTSKWDKKYGKELMEKHKDIIDDLSHMCKANLRLSLQYTDGMENMGDAIKDVTDAMMFAVRENFPLQFNKTMYADARRLALAQLYGRLYFTKEQQNYMVGLFPEVMLNELQAGVDHLEGRHLMYGYHGHRELLYALATFFQVSFEFPGLGFQKHGIPSGTTLFFELHKLNETEAIQENVQEGAGDYVRLVVFSPCANVTLTIKGNADILCKAKAYRFGFNPHSDYISFAKFRSYIEDRLNFIGSYRDLCPLGPKIASKPQHPHSRKIVKVEDVDLAGWDLVSAGVFITLGAVLAGILLCILAPWSRCCFRRLL
ncbi:hypothetical protein AAMO2058_001228900 [Amorphochlora amoebiformis]